MNRPMLDDGLPSDEPRDLPNHVVERCEPIAAEVDDFITQWFEAGDRATGDVVDVGEIALLLAVAEHDDRLPLGNLSDEAEDTHIRPPGGTVNGEVAQNGDIELMEMMIRERHCFGCLFGGRVGRQRPAGVGIFRKRHLVVLPYKLEVDASTNFCTPCRRQSSNTLSVPSALVRK